MIFDFLALGSAFLGFAKEYVELPPGHRPSFYTTPEIVANAPRRRPDWPNAHLLREGSTLSPEFLAVATEYVVERDKLSRDWLVSGPARRFAIAHNRLK